jgi:dTDP-6-deoxy-L-talose 4-dehydrogenase (NAD+)
MTRVLITGANGFVGRQIVRSLDDMGADLILVVREGKTKEVPNLANVKKIISTKDVFSEDEDWWEAQCKDVDVVIHAAWYVETGKYQDSSKNIDCLIGSLKMARGAAKAGVSRFLSLGTCAEYDQSQGVLSIDTPLKPMTTYAAAKASLFTTLSQWFPNQGVAFVWIRLFYLYGEGEDQRRLIPYVRSQISQGQYVELTSGQQVRDFMDVVEVGKYIAKITFNDQVGPVNICSGIPITVRQIVEKIADEYGRKDLLKFGAREDNPFDPPSVVGVSNVQQ